MGGHSRLTRPYGAVRLRTSETKDSLIRYEYMKSQSTLRERENSKHSPGAKAAAASP